MSQSEFRDHHRRAEGYFQLGMFADAWEVLEDLPPADRTEPLTLELRLRILTRLEKWELGEHVARVLVTSAVEPAKCRETVARFYHAHARALALAGDSTASKDQIRAAVEAWPEIRRELVEDERLGALWGTAE